jgi:hypothetical protein
MTEYDDDKDWNDVQAVKATAPGLDPEEVHLNTFMLDTVVMPDTPIQKESN